jgi:hypothetical protein
VGFVWCVSVFVNAAGIHTYIYTFAPCLACPIRISHPLTPSSQPTEVNEGFEERLSRLVAFNGQKVRNLAHLEVRVGLDRLFQSIGSIIGGAMHGGCCAVVGGWEEERPKKNYTPQQSLTKYTQKLSHKTGAGAASAARKRGRHVAGV